MKTRSRLADVAKHAGVSIATASAVIAHVTNGNIRVSPETHQRVLAAAAELGYVANPAARRLAGGRNRILGIFTFEPIFPLQHHDFFYPFLLGIEEEAERHGYQLLLFTTVTDAQGQRSIYHDETNLLYMADGSILLGLNEKKDELRRLQEEGYPFVYVGRRELPGVAISYAAADYKAATADLVCRLAALGHRRIVYVGYPHRIESSLDREGGFHLGCQQCSLPEVSHAVQRIMADAINPQRVQTWLDQGVSAALVEVDDQCQALLTVLRQLGLAVPKDFSIVMLGDPHYTWDSSPDWTMFTVPRREMGMEAVRLLVQRLERPADAIPRTVSLPCKFVAGQTIARVRATSDIGKEVADPTSEPAV